MSITVISKNGKPLMPTERRGKVRRLLKEGKAKIVSRQPFTIQLLYDSTHYTQPVGQCADAADQHIDFSPNAEGNTSLSDLTKKEVAP